jgi:hypothetical protein
MELTSNAVEIAVKRSRRLEGKWLIIGAAVLITGILSLIRLCFLWWQSFFTPQVADTPATFTLGNYRIAYGSAETLRTLGNSLGFELGAALVSFFTGTLLAWINERTNTPLRKFFYTRQHSTVIFPFYTQTGKTGAPRSEYQIRVQIDDTHTCHICYQVYPAPPGVEAPQQDSVPWYEPPRHDANGPDSGLRAGAGCAGMGRAGAGHGPQRGAARSHGSSDTVFLKPAISQAGNIYFIFSGNF